MCEQWKAGIRPLAAAPTDHHQPKCCHRSLPHFPIPYSTSVMSLPVFLAIAIQLLKAVLSFRGFECFSAALPKVSSPKWVNDSKQVGCCTGVQRRACLHSVVKYFITVYQPSYLIWGISILSWPREVCIALVVILDHWEGGSFVYPILHHEEPWGVLCALAPPVLMALWMGLARGSSGSSYHLEATDC